MNAEEFHRTRKFADTPVGRIAYVERGSGPVALFLHGFPLNGFAWRDLLGELGRVRRAAPRKAGDGAARDALWRLYPGPRRQMGRAPQNQACSDATRSDTSGA